MSSPQEKRVFYAKFLIGDETSYVRFDTRESRDYWVGKADGRFKLRSNALELKGLKEYTWEYIDGVSYGNKPSGS